MNHSMTQFLWLMLSATLFLVAPIQGQENGLSKKENPVKLAPLKIEMFQMQPKPGDIQVNFEKISKKYLEASKAGQDVLITPELALSGYGLRDFYTRTDILNPVEYALQQLLKLSENHETAMVVGHPRYNDGPGKPMFNSVSVIYRGKVIRTVDKTLLPTYGVFEDYRYFEPSKEVATPFNFKGYNIALAICEDWWASDTRSDGHPLYTRDPIAEIAHHEVDFGIAVASSPYRMGVH